ncbi:MAG: DUF393 domain-containing protein [Planctomycetota bacterium]|nr:MAG: DUF393 domain-containing protein [Planctomycetota bacterium]
MISPERNSWTPGHWTLFRVLLALTAVAAAGPLLAASAVGCFPLLAGLLLLPQRTARPAAAALSGLFAAFAALAGLADDPGLLALALLYARQAWIVPPPGVAGIGWRPPGRILLLTRAGLFALFLVKAGGGSWAPHPLDLAGSLLLVLAAAEPGWIPARPAAAAERVFFDGGCGLCHRAVLFLLREDRAAVLRFAPLGGRTFAGLFPGEAAAGFPDSLVVVRADGAPLVRSAAVVHLAGRLGGAWRPLGFLLRLLPRALADRIYDRLAAVRTRLFARPAAACPILPPELSWRLEP